MTMIDENSLRDALHSAADEFEVSGHAVEKIMFDALGESRDEPHAGATRFVHRHSRARSLLVVAASILAVGAVSWPLVANTDRGTHSSATFLSPFVGLTTPLGVAGSVQGSAAVNTSASVAGSATAKSSASLKIQSSGDVALTVPDGQIQSALDSLSALASKDGGLVDSTQAVATSQKSTAYSSATMVLQVPQRLFSTLVAQTQRVGRTTSINVQSNDVTSQYVGLQARLGALATSRQQYLSIMARATTIGDILAVQTQLNSLQSQIEQLQGQINLLNNEVTYGTLTVQLSDASHTPLAAPPSGFDRAARASIAGFVTGCEWLIRVVGPVLFSALLLGALWFAGRFTRRAIRRRRI